MPCYNVGQRINFFAPLPFQNLCTIQDLWDVPGEDISFNNILAQQTTSRDRFNTLLQMVTGKLEAIATNHQMLTPDVNIIKLPWQINVLQAIAIEVNNVALAISPSGMIGFKYKSDSTITAVSNPVAKQCYYCRLLIRDVITLLELLKKNFTSFGEMKYLAFVNLLQRVYCVLAHQF